jgi:predicted small secreted protein
MLQTLWGKLRSKKVANREAEHAFVRFGPQVRGPTAAHPSAPFADAAALSTSGDEIMNRVSALVAICAVLLLSACNTVQGVGKDIEKGGQAIEKAAK